MYTVEVNTGQYYIAPGQIFVYTVQVNTGKYWHWFIIHEEKVTKLDDQVQIRLNFFFLELHIFVQTGYFCFSTSPYKFVKIYQKRNNQGRKYSFPLNRPFAITQLYIATAFEPVCGTAPVKPYL